MKKTDGEEPKKRCECEALSDLSAVPMGCDGYDRQVFATLERVIAYGPEKWWLYISRCAECGTHWLVAQDERIYDDYFMQRLSEAEVEQAKAGHWPERFQTYEDVLSVGRKISTPPRFIEALSPALVCTAEDLLRERPKISTSEIAHILGITDDHAEALIAEARKKTGGA